MQLSQDNHNFFTNKIVLVLLGLLALFGLLHGQPALAHHPFAMGDSSDLNAIQGFLSGVGHPLLGPDHLLFLVAIGFVGLTKPLRWVMPLLTVGLAGSLVSQWITLPSSLDVWAEALVSLSLVVEGCVILNILPTWLLLPSVGLHGFLLGSAIVGAEPTPLFAYFLGLVAAQGILLTMIALASKRFSAWAATSHKTVLAGVWIGIGTAFAWSVLIP